MTIKKPPKPKTTITFQISKAEFEKMKQLATEEDLSVSQIVRRALRKEMNERKPVAA